MIIERLDLIAFGRFHQESLDLAAGPRKFHLVYGPNESGKSTCLRAISSLLFGIPNKSSDNYLHGNQKLRVGATLADPSAGRLSVIRRKGLKATLLESDGETVADPARLAAMLGGIDEATFRHRFGLSHEQLVEGGKAVLASKGELGEILFAAGAGVGRLKSIQKELESEADALFLGRGKKKINLLLKELEEKRKELRDCQTMPAEYRSLVKTLEEAEIRSTGLSEQLASTNREFAKRRAYRDARKIVPVWIRDKARLKELDSVPKLSDDFSASRREAAANRETYEKLVGNLKGEIDSIEQRIDSTPISTATIQHEDEIVGLFQGIAARRTAMNEQSGLQRIVTGHNLRIRELLHDLDVDVPEDLSQMDIDGLVDRLHVSDSAQLRIAELAADCELRRQQESESFEKLQSLRKHLADLEDELERTPAVHDPRSLDSVLTDVGAPASLLDPVEQQQTICRDLESECDSLLRKLNLQDVGVAAAVKIQSPTPEQIDEHDEVLSKRNRAREDAETSLDQLHARRRQEREKLTRLQAKKALPTEDELSNARKKRDQMIDQIGSIVEESAKIREVTGELRHFVRDADEVVDTIRSHQEQITERAAVQREISELDSKIEAAEIVVESAVAMLEQSQSDWKQLWSRCIVSVGSVRQMRTWASTLHILVDKADSLQKSRQRLQTADERVERCVSRLTSAVRLAWSARPVTAGPVDSETFDATELNLESLHDVATSLRSELAAAASQVEQLERKRSEIQLEIPRAEAGHETCVSRRKEWEENWYQAVDSFSDEKDSSPSVISTRLKKIAKIFQEKREREIVMERIRSIDQDDESFSERVAVVAKLAGLKLEKIPNELRASPDAS